MIKVEMQIEDAMGRPIPHRASNKADDQVVKGIFVCPTDETSVDEVEL